MSNIKDIKWTPTTLVDSNPAPQTHPTPSKPLFIKFVNLNNKIRHIKKTNATFAEIQSTAIHLFGDEALNCSIGYLDSENEIITIINQEEWETCLEEARLVQSAKNLTKITVKLIEADKLSESLSSLLEYSKDQSSLTYHLKASQEPTEPETLLNPADRLRADALPSFSENLLALNDTEAGGGDMDRKCKSPFTSMFMERSSSRSGIRAQLGADKSSLGSMEVLGVDGMSGLGVLSRVENGASGDVSGGGDELNESVLELRRILGDIEAKIGAEKPDFGVGEEGFVTPRKGSGGADFGEEDQDSLEIMRDEALVSTAEPKSAENQVEQNLEKSEKLAKKDDFQGPGGTLSAHREHINAILEPMGPKSDQKLKTPENPKRQFFKRNLLLEIERAATQVEEIKSKLANSSSTPLIVPEQEKVNFQPSPPETSRSSKSGKIKLDLSLRDDVDQMINAEVEKELKKYEIDEIEKSTKIDPEGPENSYIHVGFICDGCEMNPIVGDRFQSLYRPNFDLCQYCVKRLNLDEPMIRIRSPISSGLRGDDWEAMKAIFGKYDPNFSKSEIGDFGASEPKKVVDQAVDGVLGYMVDSVKGNGVKTIVKFVPKHTKKIVKNGEKTEVLKVLDAPQRLERSPVKREFYQTVPNFSKKAKAGQISEKKFEPKKPRNSAKTDISGAQLDQSSPKRGGRKARTPRTSKRLIFRTTTTIGPDSTTTTTLTNTEVSTGTRSVRSSRSTRTIESRRRHPLFGRLKDAFPKIKDQELELFLAANQHIDDPNELFNMAIVTFFQA